jgi:hypothetical protein
MRHFIGKEAVNRVALRFNHNIRVLHRALSPYPKNFFDLHTF